MSTKYRIRYRHKEWRGKPDPSNMGLAYWHTDDCGGLSPKANDLHTKGCWGIATQKNVDGEWVTM